LTGGVLTTTNAATGISNLCSGSAAFFNAAQNLAPDFIARWRIEQPWGHLQAGAVVRDLTLNDGEYLNRSWLGYGGALSGNFFTWGKDNLTWGASAGDGIGQMISSMTAGAVATNFGGILAGQTFNGLDSRSFFTTNRRLYDSAVSGTQSSLGVREPGISIGGRRSCARPWITASTIPTSTPSTSRPRAAIPITRRSRSPTRI